MRGRMIVECYFKNFHLFSFDRLAQQQQQLQAADASSIKPRLSVAQIDVCLQRF